MNRPDSPSKIIGILFVIVLLAGCTTSTTPPSLPPTSAPPALTHPTLPPPPHPTLPPPPTPGQPIQPTQQTSLFRFIQTVQVTPDSQYLGGAFARIDYVPANDNFVVTFGGPLAQPPAGCGEKGFSYKEYTLDMQETGESGTFSCDPFDAGSVMVDNTYYFAAMSKRADQDGWHLLEIDATNWTTLVDEFFPLTGSPQAQSNDPMVAFANGQIDISSQYNDNPTGAPPAGMTAGAATHHHFFSTDLELVDEKILADSPNIVGSSLIYIDGIYNFVTANGFLGDVVVMQYDQDWNYLGVKTLRHQAHWSTGLVYDGQKFYLAYMDTSQRINPDSLPVFLNVHLAAYDRDWNLLEDIAVTDFAISDNRQPGRPWVVLHDNRLYVSYDIDTIDPTTQQEQLEWQAYVSVYELTGGPGGQPAQPTQPVANAPSCSGSDLSPVGVLQSTDHGASWTSLGNACIRGLNIPPADPTGFVLDGRVMLYFVDLGHLTQPVPQIIYRTTSTDGVNFEALQPAYTQDSSMVDPFILPMPDGTFRLYVPSGDEGIISALSSDGISFTREQGVRTRVGGMPGALALPDNRVRLFLAGNGISSEISTDGLSFTQESGLRIPAVESAIVDNPQPIRLMDGSYLMLFSVHDLSHEGQPEPWTYTEIRLATSTDGFNWTVNPNIIGYGGTSCVVELPDGRLYIYYGTANP